MISINTFVIYELLVVEGLSSFDFSIFKIWRCGGFGRYSPPYTLPEGQGRCLPQIHSSSTRTELAVSAGALE